MFKSARLKLTILYVVILMAVSILFSLIIFRIQTQETERVLQFQRTRLERQGLFRQGLPLPEPDPEVLEEAATRTAHNLVFINLGILILSTGAAYYLSGRTLKPIEEMVEEQSRFVADASHELRTPLTAMRTELEVALRGKNLDKNSKAILGSNFEEVQKLQTLSDRLLQLSHYEKEETTGFQEVLLKEVLEEAVGKTAPLAKKKQINLKTSLEEAKLTGDRSSLQELFTILLENAMKYNRKEGKISLISKTLGHKIAVKVEDSGTGMKQSELPYIFNRFYRGGSSSSEGKIDGHGLGLSIAKKIVNFHKGKIEVVSTPGKGSTFTVILPTA
jgi:signal transduction histidine kinase